VRQRAQGRTGSALAAPLLAAVERLCSRPGLSPAVLSLLALVLQFAAAGLLAAGRFRTAALLLATAAVFDGADGWLAERRGDLFAQFFDASLDCYGELGLFVGLVVYYARVNRFLYAGLACVALAGSVMTGYARARSASLVAHGAGEPVQGLERGFWERPERLGLVLVGAAGNRMAPVLWLLAVGPNLSLVMTILRARGYLRRWLERAGMAGEHG